MADETSDSNASKDNTAISTSSSIDDHKTESLDEN